MELVIINDTPKVIILSLSIVKHMINKSKKKVQYGRVLAIHD